MPCEEDDEVAEIVDDGLDMIPAPFGGIAKLFRRLGWAIGKRKIAKRKERIARSKVVNQAAGRAAAASSRATESRGTR